MWKSDFEVQTHSNYTKATGNKTNIKSISRLSTTTAADQVFFQLQVLELEHLNHFSVPKSRHLAQLV